MLEVVVICLGVAVICEYIKVRTLHNKVTLDYNNNENKVVLDKYNKSMLLCEKVCKYIKYIIIIAIILQVISLCAKAYQIKIHIVAMRGVSNTINSLHID